jgi:Uma2 family endonuclease
MRKQRRKAPGLAQRFLGCFLTEGSTIVAIAPAKRPTEYEYPTSDGKPMAETELHRILMVAVIDMLQYWYADDPKVCVSGNLLMYYVRGDKRRHVSPDVFVAFGVPKKIRDYYLTWEEGKNPSVIIELTSSSTKSEDTRKKFALYRDVLKVKEYFLFDPRADYLNPRLKGFRLRRGQYAPIAPVDGRLPSCCWSCIWNRRGSSYGCSTLQPNGGCPRQRNCSSRRNNAPTRPNGKKPPSYKKTNVCAGNWSSKKNGP